MHKSLSVSQLLLRQLRSDVVYDRARSRVLRRIFACMEETQLHNEPANDRPTSLINLTVIGNFAGSHIRIKTLLHYKPTTDTDRRKPVRKGQY